MADFGTPETWNMKVGQFIEEKEFILPQRKPQEIVEQRRKERLSNFLRDYPGAVEPETRTFIESIINRKNLYDGGVVELAKNLSNQGKSLNEILKAIQKQFPDLPGGKKGKPSDKTGVQNILKKELSSEVYNQRHGPKRFTQETIDKYLKIRNTMTTAQIQEELDISPSKQQKIDKEYGLGRRKQIVTDRKKS